MKDCSVSQSSNIHSSQSAAAPAAVPNRRRRDCSIVAGLTICIQLSLYWSSFVGSGVLLPVHILTRPGIYLPPDLKERPLPNFGRSDLVLVSEPHRWFMASEYRAGRIPLWTPYGFSGTPLARAPIFSPFELLYVLWPSPRVLPWIQLATALVAAIGSWRCASQLLELGSTAAITAGVIYPLTGFLTLWQGYDLSYPVVFFPWQILAALAILEKVSTGRVVGLAISTALTLISGPVDMAALVLLSTGLIWAMHVFGKWFTERSLRSVIGVTAATGFGWALGFLLAAPGWLPTIDYVKSGMRVASRAEGKESRPPIGWSAIPLVVFPEAFGTEKDDTVFLHESGVRLESSAGAYAGCIAVIFAIPWALLDRSRRSWVLCLFAISVFGLSWQLNIPGFVSIWRLPGLKLLSASRLVFATAWSILMLAVIGLEQLQVSTSSRRWPFHVGVCLSLGCLGLCIAGILFWPGELRRLIPAGQPGLSFADIKSAFLAPYWYQFGWLTAALGLCAGVLFRTGQQSGLPLTLAVLMVLESLSHVWNLHPQPDPMLYYPRLPALEFIQNSPPGRVLGVECLPPKLLESHQLPDIRGYDGVDPFPYIQLLSLSFDRRRTSTVEYARTMWYVPEFKEPATAEDAFSLHPVLNMLGLRYIIFQQSVELPNLALQDEGYTVFVNSQAMPRAWIPRTVKIVSSENGVLESMISWNFDPSSQAYLTSLSTKLPDSCIGTANVIDEDPQRLSLVAKMETPGLVVVGDRYSSDWQATVDGKPHPLMCVNYALRGVVLSAGEHTIEMKYVPVAFARGFKMLVCASVILLALVVWSRRDWFLRSRSALNDTPNV